jgi:dynein light chain 1
VLYASNNRIKDWAEVERLAALPGLEDLLLVGNPLYTEWKDNIALPQYRIEVRAVVPRANGAAVACCSWHWLGSK